MTDKLFDEFVKSKLEQYNSGAPMHVWERMKKEKDDRKGFFFFHNRYIILAALLLLSTGVGFLVINTNSDSKLQSLQKIQTQEKKANNYVNENENHNNPINANSNTVTVNSDSETNILPSNTKPEDNNKTEEDLIRSSKSTVVFPVQKKKSYKSSNTDPVILKTSVKNKPEISTTQLQQENTQVNLQTNNTSNFKANGSTYSLQFTGYQSKITALSFFKFSNIEQSQKRPSCPTIYGPRRRDLFLEVYLSPDYNMRTFTGTSLPGNYLAERKSTETYRTSFSTGVRLVKNMGEKTLIKAGINYSQINERLKIVSENAKQTTEIITIRTIVRAPGDTLFIRDTMYFEQTGTKYRTTYNRYRFIDLPVIFSYEFGNPDLMHFSLNAGPVFNITSFYKGEVLDTSFKPIRITTANGTGANNWRNNIGIGFFASLSVYKKLNDRIHLFGEPYVRYNFNSVTQSSNIVKQRYIITGMQLGIRYNLQKTGQRYR